MKNSFHAFLRLRAAKRALSPHAALLLAVLLFGRAANAQAPTDLLPDLIVAQDLLGEIRIDTDTLPGSKLLRLTASTPNIGHGPLEIRGSTVVSDTQQEVVQRIYRSDGTYSERLAGTMTYHPSHGHVHFDDWAIYRLRAVLADGSPGDIVAEGAKTSFCLIDLTVYDATNPSFAAPQYLTCGSTIQGITPGWADVYDLELPDQWIDITNVPEGNYWLEAEVDPLNHVLEENEDNNVARVPITLIPPPPAVPDRYEENDSIAQVVADEGIPGTAALGTIRDFVRIDGLSMEDTVDYFEFRLEETPPDSAYMRIDSQYLGSDLDLWLVSSTGQYLQSSNSAGNLEQVSLAGLAPGTYFALVVGWEGQNPDYNLTIDVRANQAPVIAVTQPAAGDDWVERAWETVPVGWTASDPDGDPTTVALFVARDRVLDKATLRLGGYDKLLGASSLANVNTADMPLGRWFVYAEVTDGRATAAQWSPGSFVLYVKGDLDFDGEVTLADWALYESRQCGKSQLTDLATAGWQHIMDMNRDGKVDRSDIRLFRKAAFAPPPAAD